MMMFGRLTEREMARAEVLRREIKPQAGCCLHVAMDDGNYADHFVESGLERAKEEGHPKCVEWAELLLKMSKTQRQKLASGGYQFLVQR